MKTGYLNLFVITIVLLAAQSLRANVKIASAFSDNMVLQADRNIAIWGVAARAEHIIVEINGNSVTIRAGFDGKWQVELPPMKYGGPYELHVSTMPRGSKIADLFILFQV